VLRLRFFVPGYQIERIGPMTLEADVDGQLTEARTYSEGGFHDYTAEVPACALATSMVPVRFSFDKASTEGRELGAVVAEVGLRTPE
jgi:hypothetical protein